MSVWKAKVFWKETEARPAGDGWEILLDGRPVRTPAKAPLNLPSRRLAQAIAAEWAAQSDEIDPLSMPMTRSANAAIDKVARQFDEVAGLVAAYGETDLCCYRADGPLTLCERQAMAWDEVLDWARAEFDAPLVTIAGVVPVAQPGSSLVRLRAEVTALDAFALTALHDLVSLSGSLVMGLAALRQRFPPDDLWERSRVDESFQESLWGADEDAAAAAAIKRRDFLHAVEFHRISRPSA